MIKTALEKSARELINDIVINYDNCNCDIISINENGIQFTNGKNNIIIKIGGPKLYTHFVTYYSPIDPTIDNYDYTSKDNSEKIITVSYEGISVAVEYNDIVEYSKIIKKMNEIKDDYLLNYLNTFAKINGTDDINELD